jgi:hypothetical protein
MQYVIEKASFSLKTNDITISDTFANYPISNVVGSVNATRTITTWNSVNFENILGDLYNRYELFNLRVRMVSYGQTVAYGVTADDRTITFQMDGLNWVGSNYNVASLNSSSVATLANATFTQNVSAIIPLEESFILTFQKQKTANITISMLNANFVVPALNAATQMPRVAFWFDVIPVVDVINPPSHISLAGSKCSTLSAYYLAGTTEMDNIDMYAVLGRENFEIGAKYNIVFKFGQSAIWAGSQVAVKGGVFNIISTGMRFQNYETSIGKVGVPMQLVNYASFTGVSGDAALPVILRTNTSNIMTFTLEAQICQFIIRFQNLVDNTEYAVAMSNTLLLFDIWKCVN